MASFVACEMLLDTFLSHHMLLFSTPSQRIHKHSIKVQHASLPISLPLSGSTCRGYHLSTPSEKALRRGAFTRRCTAAS